MDTATHANEHVGQTPLSTNEEVFDILDILLVLTRRRRMIGITVLVALFAGAIVSLLLKPNFTATAIILPPQQASSSSALLGELNSLASFGGGSAGLGIKSPADMYVGILYSRTIADSLISKFQLQALYKKKKWADTRVALKAHTVIEAGKDGLIQISVTDHDPRRASEMANAYVTQLHSMNSNLAITEAAQRRVFFDEQLEEEKKALATAEDDLRAIEQKTGLIQLSGQAQMIIQTIGQLRAQIASREVELESVRNFATEQNPEVTRLNGEISTMRQQLAKLENDQQRQLQPGNIAPPAARIPEVSLEYVRKLRDVKYHETLFDLLSRQYEAARIDEAKSAPLIQVVDHAVPPDKRSGPKRLFILAAFGAIGFIFASVKVFAEDAIRRIERIPTQAAKLKDLQSQLQRRSPPALF